MKGDGGVVKVTKGKRGWFVSCEEKRTLLEYVTLVLTWEIGE